MKTKNLIKAIEKTGLKIEISGNWYTVKGPRNYGKFCDQNGNAVCVSTCDNNDHPDATTDYFPQWYHETIKSFIADLTKPAREAPAATPLATIVDKRGFTIEMHKGLTFEQHSLEYPSQTLWEKNGVYVQKCFIPQTHNSHAIVYFVSGKNGDEFGQFPTEILAKEKAAHMALLTINQRKQFDQ